MVCGYHFKGKNSSFARIKVLTRERKKRRNFPKAKMDWLF
jgi:hypothetical protein